MVEHQLPKLNTRVRFPSPAPRRGEPLWFVAFFCAKCGFTVRVAAPLREKSRSARLLGCKRSRLWYESARIDGAGELRILIRVVLPMSIPIIATLALLVGLAYWNDWLNGLYYISDDRLFSIQVLLNRMLLDVQFLMSNSDAAKSLQQNEEFVLPSTGIRMAVAVMGALPILVVYPFFQKYFVKGIVIGAVKG